MGVIPMDRYSFSICCKIHAYSTKGSKYKHVYISLIIDCTGLGFVPLDWYLFGICYKTHTFFTKKEVSTQLLIFNLL